VRRALPLLVLLPALLGAFFEWGGPAGRGVRELRARQYDAARRSLREGRADFPRSAALRYDEALALEGAGYLDSAAAAYGQALALEGDRARAAAAFNRGNSALRAGGYAEAARWYRRALRAAPDAADVKRNLEEAIRRSRGELPPPPAGAEGAGSRNRDREHPPGPPGGEAPGGAPPERDGGWRSPPGDHEFTRAEAERWLEALERERRSGRRAPSHAAPEDRRNDRDW
jgi:tetratricopeptide (TPR) repeat protein